MDRFSDSNFDQQNIYEIYRACRLCGAGAGYKMPIIQNVVDLDGRDVELKQKIRECVQIEVSQDDKMPPLICELCVDKVNDFYEFLEMCRQTNKKTRHRLGLPPQTLARGASDTGDCILGLTEPVYVKDDSDEPVSRSKSKVKGKVKKDAEVKIKVEPEIVDERRSRRSSPVTKRRTRNSAPSPPPARDRRQTDTQQQGKKTTAPLKSILKKEKDVKMENDLPRSKRSREKETQQELPTKRVKIAVKPVTKPNSRAIRKPSPKPAPKPSPKPSSVSRASRKPPMHACTVCGMEFKSSQSLAGHQRIHPKKVVTNSKTNTSKPQKNNHCSPKETRSPPNTQSDLKCNNCERVYITRKNFLRHQRMCSVKEKVSQAVVEPAVLRTLRRLQIRVARCDSLLQTRDGCRVSGLDQDYSLDRSSIYPHISSVRSLRIKSEPVSDGMVAIGEEIKRELEEGAFVHWDSDDSSDLEDQELGAVSKRPEALSRLALKTIYSARFLGKVPRKRRRIKLESTLEQFDDDNLERIGCKVAEFDERTEEKSRADEEKSAEDCAMDDEDSIGSRNLGDDLNKDGNCEASTKASDSLQLECDEKEDSVENDELLDSKSEGNIFNDNIRDTFVNTEEEVASKSSLNLSEAESKETDENQGESVAEEIVDAEEKSQESDINRDEEVDKHDDNGEVVNSEENGESFEQNTQKSEEADTENAAKTNEGDSSVAIDDKENGITDKDSQSNVGDGKSPNEEETEKDRETEECGVKNGDTTDKCALVNGVAVPKDEEGAEENKEDISANTEFGLDNPAEGKEEITYTEENRLGLNGGGEFSDEMDRKLMEELDAQIGECEGEGDSACDRDKITLADLLPDKAHGRLDLDSIADEFNFDP